MGSSTDQRRDDNRDSGGQPDEPTGPGSVRVEEDLMGYFPEGGYYCVQLLPDHDDPRYFEFRVLIVDHRNRRVRLCGRGCRETIGPGGTPQA